MVVKSETRVLIVDDSPENLRILGEILKDYQRSVALNGKKAIELAQSAVKPDIILLDVVMPEMDGFEVCRRLKEEESTKDIPLIFITSLSDAQSMVKGFKLGAADYITKPFQSEEICIRVETHLKVKKYHSELILKSKKLEEAFSDLKKMQIKLIESEKLTSIGMLTAGVAHEINNPISAVNSSAIALEKIKQKIISVMSMYDLLTPDTYIEHIKEIHALKKELQFSELLKGFSELTTIIGKSSKRVADIVRSLRVFTRLDEDELQKIDVHENIDSTLLLLKSRTKNIDVIKDYGNIPEITCFAGKLNQVFMNLIVNAIDAVEEKETNSGNFIKISTGRIAEESKILITFEDSGAGIDDHLSEKIFEPFFTTKKIGKGMGLGLSISQSIVQKHGGELTCAKNKNKNTVFTLILPETVVLK